MKLILTIIFLPVFIFTYSQQVSHSLFSVDMLQNPENYEGKYAQIFGYNEISRFKLEKTENKIILENGYASAYIKNYEEWNKIKSGKTVKEISIIFTKYPRKKKDWITDYNKLLAARLRELFKIDPALNNANINWYLLLQTDCKTDKETRTFFHGIMMKYESFVLVNNEKIFKIKEQNSNFHDFSEHIIPEYDSINAQSGKYRFYANEKDYDSSNSFLYRNAIKENTKKRQGKMPKCPDFKKKKFKKVF